MKTFTAYNGSLRFDLFCGVSCINTVSRPALHCTDTVSPNCCCKVLISGHVITAANVDHC